MNEQTLIEDRAHNYLMDEINFVRESYLNGVEDIRKLERYAVVIVATIWSWSAANIGNPAVAIIVWIPLVTVLLFGIRAWSISLQLRAHQEYLTTVEKDVDLPEGLGWQQNRPSGPAKTRIVTGYLFWATLQILAIGIAICAAMA